MKKSFKIISVLMIVFILCGNLLSVQAFSNKLKADYILADNFDLNGFEDDNSASDDASHAITTATGRVLGVIKYICVVIAVVILLVISAKYMVSAPGDRADIKKHAVAYVIGALILFGASGILQIILEISENAIKV